MAELSGVFLFVISYNEVILFNIFPATQIHELYIIIKYV